MKVKCPKCGGFDKAPDEYTGRKVKCPRCFEKFIAVPCMEPTESKLTTPRESTDPADAPITVKAWFMSPVAFRNGFLATLGVLSALYLAYQITGLNHVFSPAQHAGPSVRSEAIEVVAINWKFIDKNPYGWKASWIVKAECKSARMAQIKLLYYDKEGFMLHGTSIDQAFDFGLSSTDIIDFVPPALAVKVKDATANIE
jgi:hypothetical protein